MGYQCEIKLVTVRQFLPVARRRTQRYIILHDLGTIVIASAVDEQMPAGTKLVDEVTAPVVGVQNARVFMPWAGNQALIPGEQVERKLLFGKVRRPLASPAAKCQHAQEYWHPDACSCSVTLEFAE